MSSFLRVCFAFLLILGVSHPAWSANDIRQVAVTVDDLLYNPADGKLYGGVTGGTNANSIVSIDPQTANLGPSIPLGSTPQKMVISSDGRYLDTVVSGGFTVRRLDTTTQILGIQWSLGNDYSALYAEDMVALPGSPGSVVISRSNVGISPRHKDIVIFDNGVLRPTNRAAGANTIAVTEDGKQLYGYFSEISSFDFPRWTINGNVFEHRGSIHPISGFNNGFKYAGGRAYSASGLIFDPETGVTLGTYSSQSLGMTLPDVASGKLFTSSQSGTNVTIRVRGLNNLIDLGSIIVPNVSGTPSRLVRWGINGLAFRAGNQVYLIRNSLVGILPPVVTAVSPVQAKVGTSVVITGQELGTTTSVKFNGIDAMFQAESDTQIRALVPAGATSGPLRVTNLGGSAEVPFTVLVPTLSVADTSIAEGDSGTTNLDFTVRLSYPSNETVSFDFTTVDGTALAGTDYNASSGSRSFAPGETSLTISVPILGDKTYEPDETFALRLFNVIGATTTAPTSAPPIRNSASGHFYERITTTTMWDTAKAAAETRNYWGIAGHLATITSADEEAFIDSNFDGVTFWLGAIQATGSTEPAEGFGWITGEPFTYTNWDSGEPNNAPLNGQPANEDAVQRNNFNKWNDVARNTNAPYLVEYDVAADASGPDGEATGTIVNDDSLPSLSVGNATVAEGDADSVTADFTITLTGDTALPVTVNYATSDGSATAGSDYTATSGTVTFNPGETSKAVSVAINGDILDEDDETLDLILSSPTNATLSNDTGLGTITDDDTSVLSVDNPSVQEGNSGTTELKFTLQLSKPNSRALKVNYQTADAQSPAIRYAATADVDYEAVPSTSLTFEPNETTKTVTVLVNGDTDREINEVVALFVTGAENISGSYRGLGTIINDDGVPQISIDDVSVTEGSGGATTRAVFTVTLSAPSFQSVKVNYATSTGSNNGTATAGSDYVNAKGTLTFAPGETSKPVTVVVNNDVLDEDDETFSVLLSSPINAAIANGQGKGTIVDDDLAPSLSFVSTSVSQDERNSGERAMTFSVRLSAPSSRPVQFTYQTVNGTALATSDYAAIVPQAVTIPAGSLGTQILIGIKGDTLYEADERFRVVLSAPVNASIAPGKGVAEGIIVNDDVAPTFSINNVQVIEGNGGSSKLNFTVKLSAPSGLPASVRYATTNGTAVAGSDYFSTFANLVFSPGETTRTVIISVKGDTLPESDEQLKVVLSNAVGASLSPTANIGIGTILDDDRPNSNARSAGSS